MLKSFESHCELEEVRIVCNKLCSLKKRIEKGNFSDPFKEYKDCDNIFDSIKAKAIDIGDESLANAQMIYRHYFKFFSTFASYHLNLIENRYKNSWDILQDCLDEAKIVGEFVDIKDRMIICLIWMFTNELSKIMKKMGLKLYFGRNYLTLLR